MRLFVALALLWLGSVAWAQAPDKPAAAQPSPSAGAYARQNATVLYIPGGAPDIPVTLRLLNTPMRSAVRAVLGAAGISMDVVFDPDVNPDMPITIDVKESPLADIL